jgi:hypothetical protein
LIRFPLTIHYPRVKNIYLVRTRSSPTLSLTRKTLTLEPQNIIYLHLLTTSQNPMILNLNVSYSLVVVVFLPRYQTLCLSHQEVNQKRIMKKKKTLKVSLKGEDTYSWYYIIFKSWLETTQTKINLINLAYFQMLSSYLYYSMTCLSTLEIFSPSLI